jgi:hypothetical protein
MISTHYKPFIGELEQENCEFQSLHFWIVAITKQASNIHEGTRPATAAAIVLQSESRVSLLFSNTRVSFFFLARICESTHCKLRCPTPCQPSNLQLQRLRPAAEKVRKRCASYNIRPGTPRSAKLYLALRAYGSKRPPAPPPPPPPRPPRPPPR